MPNILVTRFPGSQAAADAGQLGFGPCGYGSLLHGAGFSPTIADFNDALDALGRGTYDLCLAELENGAGHDMLERFGNYLRTAYRKSKERGSACALVPIITGDGLLQGTVRQNARDLCLYTLVKPMASPQRFTDDLANLVKARVGNGTPYVKIAEPPSQLEAIIAERVNNKQPLLKNKEYPGSTYTLRKEHYVGMITRDISLNFFPKNKLAYTAVDVQLYRLAANLRQKQAGAKQVPIPQAELHLQ